MNPHFVSTEAPLGLTSDCTRLAPRAGDSRIGQLKFLHDAGYQVCEFMRKMQITTTFFRQFKHLSTMLKTAINRCPDTLWGAVRTRQSYSPAMHAYHAIRTLAMPHMLNIPSIELPIEPGLDNMPAKDDVLVMLDEITEYMSKHLVGLTDKEILYNGEVPSVSNLMYALRHAQHHIGMMIGILVEHDIKEPAWSSANMQ